MDWIALPFTVVPMHNRSVVSPVGDSNTMSLAFTVVPMHSLITAQVETIIQSAFRLLVSINDDIQWTASYRRVGPDVIRAYSHLRRPGRRPVRRARRRPRRRPGRRPRMRPRRRPVGKARRRAGRRDRRRAGRKVRRRAGKRLGRTPGRTPSDQKQIPVSHLLDHRVEQNWILRVVLDSLFLMLKPQVYPVWNLTRHIPINPLYVSRYKHTCKIHCFQISVGRSATIPRQ